MELYELLEPVEKGEEYFVNKKAFEELNELLGTELNGNKHLIIEIVGTSAVGKTSFKNMIINCLRSHKGFKIYNEVVNEGSCPESLSEENFSNFKGDENSAIIFEYNFYVDPRPTGLEGELKTLGDKLENLRDEGKTIKYMYMFFDEFDYYLSYRKELKDKGTSEEELDKELYQALKEFMGNHGYLRIILFILTPVVINFPKLPINDEDVEKELTSWKDPFGKVQEVYFEENFKPRLFFLDITNNYTLTINDSLNKFVTTDLMKGKFSSSTPYGTIKDKFNQVSKIFFKDNAVVPIYYIKYLSYLFKKGDLIDTIILSINNITIIGRYFAEFIKSRARFHFKYLLPQIINEISGIDEKEFNKYENWNFYKKVMDRGDKGIDVENNEKQEKLVKNLRTRSVVNVKTEVKDGTPKEEVVNIFNYNFSGQLENFKIGEMIPLPPKPSKIIFFVLLLSLIEFIIIIAGIFIRIDNLLQGLSSIYYAILDIFLFIGTILTLSKPTKKSKMKFVTLWMYVFFFSAIITILIVIMEYISSKKFVNYNTLISTALVYLLTLIFVVISPLKTATD